jgi:hypothetical protein
MSQKDLSNAEVERQEEQLAEEEAEAAAAEAGKIGGSVPSETEDPAERPLAEAGQGEAEGFELAEERLEDVASHGDQHRFPGRDAMPPEEPTETEYGEPDRVLPPEE